VTGGEPNREVYFSVDIESDGPCPGLNSMLSLGAVAYNADGVELATFSRNLELLPDASPDPKTSQFWNTHYDLYQQTRFKTEPPERALPEFDAWVQSITDPKYAVFVAYPAGYDFTWVFYYLHRFTGGCVFGWSSLDMKTLAMARTGLPFKQSHKGNWPDAWFGPSQHTHVALDDAREQGEQFFRMRCE
jgi:hypothetical protein